MLKCFLFLTLFLLGCAQVPSQSHSPTDKTIRIAAVNFKIWGAQDLPVHLKHIEALTVEAKRQGAKFLLLPELMVFDMLPSLPADEKMREHLEALARLAPSYEKGLKNIATGHDMNIVGASVVIRKKSHFVNRAFSISHKGTVSYQDKIWPTPWEVRHGFVGGGTIKLFKTDEFSFSILICHDAEFPSISSALAKTKPEVLFVPSQTDDVFGLKRVESTARARAIEHMAYVVMTGDSGDTKTPWHAYVGQSFLFAPQNKYFESEKSGSFSQEELSLFEINLSKLRESRADKKQVYPARDMSGKF